MKYIKKFENIEEEKYIIYTYGFGDLVFNLRQRRERFSLDFDTLDKINTHNYEIAKYTIEEADNAVKYFNKNYKNRFEFIIISESEFELMNAANKYNI
jgi:hypothetical protein